MGASLFIYHPPFRDPSGLWLSMSVYPVVSSQCRLYDLMCPSLIILTCNCKYLVVCRPTFVSFLFIYVLSLRILFGILLILPVSVLRTINVIRFSSGDDAMFPVSVDREEKNGYILWHQQRSIYSTVHLDFLWLPSTNSVAPPFFNFFPYRLFKLFRGLHVGQMSPGWETLS